MYLFFYNFACNFYNFACKYNNLDQQKMEQIVVKIVSYSKFLDLGQDLELEPYSDHYCFLPPPQQQLPQQQLQS